jgi:hypothetical protein
MERERLNKNLKNADTSWTQLETKYRGMWKTTKIRNLMMIQFDDGKLIFLFFSTSPSPHCHYYCYCCYCRCLWVTFMREVNNFLCARSATANFKSTEKTHFHAIHCATLYKNKRGKKEFNSLSTISVIIIMTLFVRIRRVYGERASVVFIWNFLLRLRHFASSIPLLCSFRGLVYCFVGVSKFSGAWKSIQDFFIIIISAFILFSLELCWLFFVSLSLAPSHSLIFR